MLAKEIRQSNRKYFSSVAITCCVLHNICQMNKDEYIDDEGILKKFRGKSGKLDKEEGKIITEILTVLQFGYAEQIL